MQHICASAYRVSWKKAVLVEAALAHIPYSEDVISSDYIVQSRQAALQFCLFLYFGKIETNLQNFTMRDLGLVKTPDFKTDYGARFETAAEAQTAYFYADGLHRFKQGTDPDIAGMIDGIDDWPAPLCAISSNSREKLLQKLGGLSERLEDIDTALSLYQRSDTPLCNERIIRLRYSRGDKDWVETRLQELIETPASDEEDNFAELEESETIVPLKKQEEPIASNFDDQSKNRNNPTSVPSSPKIAERNNGKIKNNPPLPNQ